MVSIFLRNAKMVDVEIGTLKRADIAIEDSRFLSVDEPKLTKGKRFANVIDCSDKYVVPGLFDSHTHTELALSTIAPYAEGIIPCGTTSAIIDCHDFVNVIGMKGLNLLISESKKIPLRAFFMAPSCVPSVVSFEDSGAAVLYADVRKALMLPKVLGLGEVMDVAGILKKDRKLEMMIDFAKEKNKIIDGHCPNLSEKDESIYFKLSCAKTDHESTSIKEIFRKLGKGIWVHLRRTSLGQEYSYKKVFEKNKDKIMLCSDGCIAPPDVSKSGHISAFIKEIINEGVNPVDVIKAATINPAICYGLESDLGSIKKGKKADFLILSDLKRFNVERVFINGKEIVKREFPRFRFPSYSLNTIRMKIPSKFLIAVKVPEHLKHQKKVMVNVIKLKHHSLLTEKAVCKLQTAQGVVNPDIKQDILKVVVMERYGKEVLPATGFIAGFGIKNGAFGGSIAQDSQNIVVVGCSDEDIISVIRAIKKYQGGIFYSKNGKVVSKIKLPIAGIMSDKPFKNIADDIDRMNKILKKNGSTLKSPSLTLSLSISLVVIPELKLSNRGLIDVKRMRFINIFKEMDN